MAPRTKLAAAMGTVAAAALLLSACGGGGNDDKIASSPTPSASSPTTAPATTTTPANAGTPTFDFPSDVKVVVDADTTGNATKDTILRDQAYGEKAIFLAIAKLDPNLPQLKKYLSGEALKNWVAGVKWSQSHHKTVTGTTLFYKRNVLVTGADIATVVYCESERNAYAKDPRTGKVTKTAPSLNDFTLHSSDMVKGSDGTWTMITYDSQKRSTSCQR